MSELQPNHEAVTQPEAAELESKLLRPRIYVASLSDYNNGVLHGEWIDADQEPDELWAEVSAMLARSEEPHAEEWAIHDFEDFASIYLGEWESFSTVSRLAAGLVEHGRPFAYWANYVGHADAEQLERFEEAYLGVWESEAHYGEQMMEDWGIQAQIDDVLSPQLSGYWSVNYKQFGEDALSDCHTVRDADGLHVFLVV